MQIFLFAQGAAGEAASAAETTQMARKGAKNAQQMAGMYVWIKDCILCTYK